MSGNQMGYASPMPNPGYHMEDTSPAGGHSFTSIGGTGSTASGSRDPSACPMRGRMVLWGQPMGDQLGGPVGGPMGNPRRDTMTGPMADTMGGRMRSQTGPWVDPMAGMTAPSADLMASQVGGPMRNPGRYSGGNPMGDPMSSPMGGQMTSPMGDHRGPMVSQMVGLASPPAMDTNGSGGPHGGMAPDAYPGYPNSSAFNDNGF